MVNNLCFATYAITLQRALAEPNNNQDIAEYLLGYIIEYGHVRNKHNETVHIDPKMVSGLFRRGNNVQKNIIEAASSIGVLQQSVEYFNTKIVPFLKPALIEDLIANISGIVFADDTIPETKREKLLALAEEETLGTFLSEVFLYAIQKPNIEISDEISIAYPAVSQESSLIIRKPSKNHAYKWEPDYSGQVWISLHPVHKNKEQEHSVKINWGAWRWETITPVIMPNGAILITGKAPDAFEAVTMTLICDHEIYARFGEGDIEKDDRVIDIRQGWKPIDEE